MALVNVEVGVTMHIGDPQRNEYFRCTIGIRDIDVALPIYDQLEQARVGLKETLAYAQNILDTKIVEALER